jgi:hypothetical protein
MGAAPPPKDSFDRCRKNGHLATFTTPQKIEQRSAVLPLFELG